MTHTHSSARAAERRGPQKSPQAFRTISEVSQELDVPAHVLRFWESRFTQVRPMKRAGGRRYYRPGDVALLKGIRRLLYSEGLTIKGAQKVMRERGVRFVAGLGEGAPGELLQPAESRANGARVNGAGHPRENRETGAVQARTGAGQKPLLTKEKRANLEAALSLLNDLRTELSTMAKGDRLTDSTGEELQKEPA